MTERQIKLIVGSLLHDIGKIVYRSGDGRNHSQSGYEYLKTSANIDDEEILNCIRYHHGYHLKNAKLSLDTLAYLTYYADNIAASVDRREKDEQEDGFDKSVPLSSVFNILNGNHGNYHFEKTVMDFENGIHFPNCEAVKMDPSFYQEVIHNITENLRAISWTEEYINSLLSILEANLSYIPSSTSKRELADISLYDHVKITAAVAACMEQYFAEKGETNYKEQVLLKGKELEDCSMFLLYSMDISGIQSFIYTISSKGALKGLRARSFYLEIMMEHLIDELLKRLSLCRANMIYCGGGHSYLLLPNTEEAKEKIEQFEKDTNNWFLKQFGIALYLAGGYGQCSSKTLRNEPAGSYSDLYRTVSRKISAKKMNRYSSDQILWLNHHQVKDGRECEICKKVDLCNRDNKCPTCAALEKMSEKILSQDFFTVLNEPEPNALPLPHGKYLTADTKESLLDHMNQKSYVRSYTKNKIYSGKHVTTKLWVGDYTSRETFEQLAENALGIKRIAILRADVDNMGQAFVSGFLQKDGNDQYMTLSRTATLSRQLSLFFKCYMNHILKNGSEERFSMESTYKKRNDGLARNAVIVYSGGDDVFLAGAWNDVIAAFIDLKKAFAYYTQNTLTISGGIGIYSPGYPINIMAKEVEELEQCSKNQDGKDSITLFDESCSFSWKTFLEKVLDEKFSEMERFFGSSEERGMGFLYHLLNFFRSRDEKINRARFLYTLSRLEPEKKDKDQWESYRLFAQNMNRWIDNEEDCRQVIAAMYLYVYLNRNEE